MVSESDLASSVFSTSRLISLSSAARMRSSGRWRRFGRRGGGCGAGLHPRAAPAAATPEGRADAAGCTADLAAHHLRELAADGQAEAAAAEAAGGRGVGLFELLEQAAGCRRLGDADAGVADRSADPASPARHRHRDRPAR
jgi:hypothetical protein